jgi:glycosyltransferase involved in cell wall biosynthesis
VIKVLYPSIYPPGFSPGQRFRIEQYIPYLKEAGIEIDMVPYFRQKDFDIMYGGGKVHQKIIAVFSGFFRRLTQLRNISKYDFIYVQRDVMPIGPAFFEWIYKFVFRKKIIFDFDDAVWMPGTIRTFYSRFRSYNKVAKVIQWSTATAAGNNFLLDYANTHTDKAVWLPTVVDTERLHNKIKEQTAQVVTIGWTGSFSTNYYMNTVAEALAKLNKKYGTNFLVISNSDPKLNNVKYDYLEWSHTDEIQDLLKADIGIMPLLDGDWELGKCGFKAIQFMALGIPVVASNIGANKDIIEHGIDSFLYDTMEEWMTYMEKLIENPQFRAEMGLQARKKVETQFSVRANLDKMIQLFK